MPIEPRSRKGTDEVIVPGRTIPTALKKGRTYLRRVSKGVGDFAGRTEASVRQLYVKGIALSIVNACYSSSRPCSTA